MAKVAELATGEVKDFDAEYNLADRSTKSFKLGGHVYRTKGYAPPHAFLGREDGVRYAVTFLRAVILKEDREVFDAMLTDPEAVVDTTQVDDVAVWLMGELSKRPTVSPDSSGNGGETTSST